jgi:hypothetical protein
MPRHSKCQIDALGLPTLLSPRFNEPYYLALRQRGLSATAAFVALGRKLARVCFALLKNGTEFNPELRLRACATT